METPVSFSEEHYRTLFHLLDLALCTIELVFDADGQPIDYWFLDVNHAFEEQTGLRNAAGRTIRELAPSHEDRYYQIYGRVATTGEPVRFEHRARTLGRWYEVFACRIGDPALRRVAVMFRDITVRKEAQAALHASETRYRALAQSISNAIYRFSADGTRLIEVYGGSVPQHLTAAPPHVSWLDGAHPDDREAVKTAWFEAVKAGVTFQHEVRARLANGSWGWLLSRALPVRDNHGRIVEWIGSLTDITAQKQAEESLRRSEADHAAARREAERASRIKDQFLAMLGHELRNPLAPMLTALQLMRLRGSASREQDVLERQVRHLTRMVDDLLDVSRITRGKIELKRRPVELWDVVSLAMELAGPMLEEHRNHVDLQVQREGALIEADPDRLAQVVSNLLTNASKYSDRGSPILVSGSSDGRVVRLSVKDRGIGIAPDMLGSVFDAFVQQPQTLERSGGGLGLGLAIVRNLVAAHDGTVTVTSEGLNRGSEFTIELPTLDLRAAGATSGPLPAPRRAAVAGTPKVLVVDDNADAADMLREALEHLGYAVEVAYDGPSALARANTFKPATVLLDIGLPVMDGYEVARRLRAMPWAGPPMRLFAVTGYGQDADRQRAHDAGFERHLVKPIDLDELERLMARSA